MAAALRGSRPSRLFSMLSSSCRRPTMAIVLSSVVPVASLAATEACARPRGVGGVQEHGVGYAALSRLPQSHRRFTPHSRGRGAFGSPRQTRVEQPWPMATECSSSGYP